MMRDLTLRSHARTLSLACALIVVLFGGCGRNEPRDKRPNNAVQMATPRHLPSDSAPRRSSLPTSSSLRVSPQGAALATVTTTSSLRLCWLPALTTSPAELIPEPDETGLAAVPGPSVRLFVFDRVHLRPAADVAFYPASSATHHGPFVTNQAGFTRIWLAPGHEKDTAVELEVMGNVMPLLSEQIRLLPSNPQDRRFRLPLQPVARDTVFLAVVPVVRVEVGVYEDTYKRMINVPVTFTPANAVTREPLTLTAGAEDEMEAARFCIPAREGDTYRVSVGENINTPAHEVGVFTVRAYREPIQLRINLYPGVAPLEVISTEH